MLHLLKKQLEATDMGVVPPIDGSLTNEWDIEHHLATERLKLLNPCSRSAIKSSTSSIPTDKRSKVGVIPRASLVASGKPCGRMSPEFFDEN